MSKKISIFTYVNRLEVSEKEPLPVSFHFQDTIASILSSRDTQLTISDDDDNRDKILTSYEHQSLLP